MPTSGNGPNYLWAAIVALYVAFVTAGTLSPWHVAVARLGEFGTGPYLPLTYSYLCSDTRTYRSQIYLVPSQVGSSWSTYRVSQENERVRVEEVRYGVLYTVVFAAAAIVSSIWSVRRVMSRQLGVEADA